MKFENYTTEIHRLLLYCCRICFFSYANEFYLVAGPSDHTRPSSKAAMFASACDDLCLVPPVSLAIAVSEAVRRIDRSLTCTYRRRSPGARASIVPTCSFAPTSLPRFDPLGYRHCLLL